MLKFQIKLFCFSLLVGGSYYGGLKYTETKYDVDSPEALVESDAPEFLARIYSPYYKVKKVADKVSITAMLEELDGKVKDMRKTSMDQLDSI